MTEPPSPSVRVRCRRPLGAREDIEVIIKGDADHSPAGLPARTVIVDGIERLQKWVPRDRPELFGRLDREVRAGVRFAQVYKDLPYPWELPRLVAYDVDGEEPFALLEPYRGVPEIGRAHV